MNDTIQQTTDLSVKEKRMLLEQLLKEKAKTSKSVYPLSYNQRAMWFVHQLAPHSSSYNLAFVVRIRSKVNVPALKRAVQTLVDRHASLRTTFTIRSGEPVQEVHGYQEVNFEEIDSSTWDEEELNRQVVAAYQQPFNLERGPVLRVYLFSRSAAEHVLLLALHHLVFDGWSKWLLLDELRVLYDAESTGISPNLSPLKVQYSDYIAWQAEMLASPEGEKLGNYWRQQLDGDLPILNLPLDRPRPPTQTFRGATHTFTLDEALAQQVKELAKAEGVTLYMVLLATFQILLHRYSGQKDILVGSPVSGRSRVEFSDTVGDFINMVVLRAKFDNNPTFKTFLDHVRQTVLDALAHQDYPFSLLVEQLVPERDSSYSPLFQVMFALQKAQRFGEAANLLLPSSNGPRVNFGGLELEPFPLAQQEGQLDVALDMMEVKGVLVAELRYNTDLFDAITISRMAGHFRTILTGIIANPEERLLDLPLLAETERHQLLVVWNDTQTDYPRNSCLHQLFEAQVKRTPETVAVIFEGKQLTYRELNRRANRLAHYLQSLEVGPDKLVGICVERSLEMLVGLLGILKAGGAYVPLDPAFPKDRLAFMLADSQASVLITQQRLAPMLPEHNAQVLYLDTDWPDSGEKPENPVSKVKPADLAYVIYTSGSTGKPKGVQISHRAAVNFLTTMQQQPGLTEQDVLLAVTTLSFDIALLELFLPLIVGARVVVVSREVAIDGVRLQEALANSGATLMQATPATWRLLLEAGWQGSNHLKVLCGGEALPPELANQLLVRCASLWNMYGPTETTVWSTIHRIDPSDKQISIGRPIANTEIYILDSNLQPVPAGVPGELHIGGDGLARGYLNRPELTAGRFIKHPFKDEAGARIYKTGDLARYLPDSTIECLGRLDHQVKIRGFRIELGEIEAVLSQYPAVQENVVVVREDTPGDKRLVAYLIVNQTHVPQVGDLQRFLQETLPDYMIPSTYVFLDTFPLTPNRKVDRKALPVPNQLKSEPQATFIAPQDNLELQLTKLWEKILGRRSIGVQDNFFELGGHSLLGVRLFAQVEKLTGHQLPLATLFQAPTIEQLASIIRNKGWSESWSSLVPIQPNGSKLPFYCVHGAGGHILEFYSLAHQLGTDQPFYGLQAQGLDGTPVGDLKIEDMATHYIQEIRTIQPEGPYLIGGYCFGGLVAFEMARQLRAQGEEVALLAMLHCASPQYADSLFKVSRFRRMVYALANKVELELSNLTVRNFNAQLAYILERVRRVRDLTQAKIEETFAPMLTKFQPDQRHSMAYIIESTREVNVRAFWNYTPQPYQGRVAFFRASKQPRGINPEPMLGWNGLFGDNLEIYEIPGYQENIIDEPRVQILAEKLKMTLVKAQQE